MIILIVFGVISAIFYSDNSIDMLNNDMTYSWQDGEQ